MLPRGKRTSNSAQYAFHKKRGSSFGHKTLKRSQRGHPSILLIKIEEGRSLEQAKRIPHTFMTKIEVGRISRLWTINEHQQSLDTRLNQWPIIFGELDSIKEAGPNISLCLKTIPHNKFSFTKILLMAAQFEIRQLDIDQARRILGLAIGKAPKDKIFKKYIEIELQFGNIEHCRKLYAKYLEWSPENCYAWIKFAELERSLAETERARALFELAIGQPALDMPELLWKAYIDFEISEGEYERTRGLYERLLNRTKHMKVWISYAKFEASALNEGFQDSDVHEIDDERKRECLQHARAVFERALSYFRNSAPELEEERAMLLEEWLNMESSFGELGDGDLVRVKLPKKLKRRRHIETDYEEYTDYLFPDKTQTTNLKILETAYKWKKQKIDSNDD